MTDNHCTITPSTKPTTLHNTMSKIITPPIIKKIRRLPTLIPLALLLTLTTACSTSTIPGTKLQHNNLTLRYDTNRDRILYLGPTQGPNLLETRNLNQPPDPNGNYTFFGGAYTWIAPQNQWRDTTGNLKNWPPDPLMDRGPTTITNQSENQLKITGPETRDHLIESTTITIVDSSTITIRHILKNTGTKTIQRAVWSTTAIPPGATIAVNKTSDNLFDSTQKFFRLDNQNSKPLWNQVARTTSEWFTIKTTLPDPTEKPSPDSFKVFFDRVNATQIAYWSRGYWLLRTAEPPDIFRSLQTVGESSVEIYANFGLQLFEAELLSPLQPIAPQKQIAFEETWKIIPSKTPNLETLTPYLAQ